MPRMLDNSFASLIMFGPI